MIGNSTCIIEEINNLRFKKIKCVRNLTMLHTTTENAKRDTVACGRFYSGLSMSLLGCLSSWTHLLLNSPTSNGRFPALTSLSSRLIPITFIRISLVGMARGKRWREQREERGGEAEPPSISKDRATLFQCSPQSPCTWLQLCNACFLADLLACWDYK